MILIAAIAVGALAAFAIFNYVGGIEDRANDNARRVPVIRIAQDIPRGLTGTEARDQGYLELDAEIVRRAVARGEAAEDVDAKAVIEAVLGPVYFRLIVTGEVPDRDFIERIADVVAAGVKRSR